MTAEEKMQRVFAVENMYRIYQKYYTVWKQAQSGS